VHFDTVLDSEHEFDRNMYRSRLSNKPGSTIQKFW
jgi:hypothetical protein